MFLQVTVINNYVAKLCVKYFKVLFVGIVLHTYVPTTFCLREYVQGTRRKEDVENTVLESNQWP